MPVVTLSNGTNFQVEPGSSILDAALAKGLVLEHSCRTGRCGSCKARVMQGETAVLRPPVSLTEEQQSQGWVLTCTHEARSDVTLDIEDLGALVGIEARITPARIDSLERLAPDVLRVVLRLPPRTPFRFLAGQYVDVTSPTGVPRSYSIASDQATPDRIELQVRRVEGGVLSAYWFKQAKVNDLLRFSGPRGTFFLRPLAGLDLVFLATGTGIAPILSMLRQLSAMEEVDRPRSVSLYWGGRHPVDHYLDPRGVLAELRYVPVLSRGGADRRGVTGHVQDVLVQDVKEGHASALSGSVVYACGSQVMIEGARSVLVENGLLKERFHFDAFVSSN